MMDWKAVALTIAGSDPSGGAGLQADLKTFQQLGVFGMSVVTLLTVQNTQTVDDVRVLDADLVLAQLDSVLRDIPSRAIKTGALGNADVVKTVASRLASVDAPVVIDPVLVSKHGFALAEDHVVDSFKQHLLPRAYLITPNRFEAERLTGESLADEESAHRAARKLNELGAKNVLIKLGRVGQSARHLLYANNQATVMDSTFDEQGNTHGSGCTLAAAITAQLALGETDLASVVRFAIDRTLEAIQSPSKLGQGIHPVDSRAMKRA
jgi:hydroxymethylpyrimidine/phosphomethylpyrimidine kinase